MLQANELRLNNFIFYKGEQIIVTMIGEFGIQSKNEEHLINAKFATPDLEPIPLSKKWMLRFGFEAFPWGWVKKSKSDFGVRLNLQSFSYDMSGNNPVRLQFVHQLQNLFFVLTGEELEVVANGS